jgi:hypothetical protein
MVINLRPGSTSLASRKFKGVSSPDKTAIGVIDGALHAASQLAALLNHEWDAQRMTLDLLLPVSAITHIVLSLPRPMQFNTTSPLCAIAALVRMSVIAMLSTVITTTSGDTLYCVGRRRTHARELLVQCEHVWVWAELKMWVLVIQALIETGPRAWLLNEITEAMAGLSLSSWDELVATLQRVVWVDKAAMTEMQHLRNELETHRTNQLR